MGLKEKLNKIKAEATRKSIELPENEKTGVLNGLIVLGATIGALISQQQTSHGTPTPTICANTVNDKVTQTEIPADNLDLGFLPPAISWQDHCWWDHCWWDHNWWDHSWWDFGDFADSGGGGAR